MFGGVAIIYIKTQLRTHLNGNYGISLSQYRRFLDDTHTKCVRKETLICQISILVGSYMANSTDPDETPRFAASHLGLCYL